MLDENSASNSPTDDAQSFEGEEIVGQDDLGKLVGDTSFSDVTSDDSSGWMHKIDVTNFQRLTSNSSADNGTSLAESTPGFVMVKMERMEPTGFLMPKTEAPTSRSESEDERRLNFQFSYGSSSAQVLPKLQSATSSRPYDSRQFNIGSKLSPPPKKLRQRDSSEPRQFEEKRKSSEAMDIQQQISVVSSSSDAPRHGSNRQYPKPVYSYSCMIALALKNSQTGRLQVAEIYCFMCENYPYFRTAPAGWKNSVRHNLSLNKCFEKVEVEAPGGHGRKCCLWALNPQKVTKMDQEIRKYREKDPAGVRDAYARPEDMELIEQGLKGMPTKANYYTNTGYGRTVLPEVVVQSTDNHHEAQTSPFMTVDTTSGMGGGVDAGVPAYIGVGKSELALKLLQQAASYSPASWNRYISAPQSAFGIPASSIASWPPSQIENNRNRFTPSATDQCPLEFSPIHHQGVNSPPPYSTPVRRSSVAACYSPFSRYQSESQHRPSSLHQVEMSPASIWFQPDPDAPADLRPLPVFSSNCRTPERPSAHGYAWGDGMFGGNNSLLVTPTHDGQQHRGTFGTSFESAFCAATANNNSLIIQSMQQQMEEQQHPHQDGSYPLLFTSIGDNPADGGLHLTSL